MKLSYERIGAWSATFTTEDAVEGQVVKMTGSGSVGLCAAGEAFCGVAEAVRGTVCGVQLGGLAEVRCSGDAIAVGPANLAADGNGGVCTAENGQNYLVLAVDASAGKCVIKL